MVGAERNNAVARAHRHATGQVPGPFVLRDVEGKSYEEISRIMRRAKAQSNPANLRARELLREKLRAISKCELERNELVKHAAMRSKSRKARNRSA